MNHHEHAPEFATGLLKIAPPAYVAGTSIMGLVDWQMWVYVATFIYILMQMGQHVWEKWVKPWRKGRRARRFD
jgi:hypothetical protein